MKLAEEPQEGRRPPKFKSKILHQPASSAVKDDDKIQRTTVALFISTLFNDAAIVSDQ